MAEEQKRKYGITNIVTVLTCGFHFAELAYKVKNSEASLVDKAKLVIRGLADSSSILQVDLKELREEYFDLDQAERDEIKAIVKKEFDLEDDGLEEKVEAYFSYGFDLVFAIQNLADLYRDTVKPAAQG